VVRTASALSCRRASARPSPARRRRSSRPTTSCSRRPRPRRDGVRLLRRQRCRPADLQRVELPQVCGLPAADPLVTASARPASPRPSRTAPTSPRRPGTTSTVRAAAATASCSPPAYQNGFVHSGGRGVPDISYSGDVNNGLLIAWSQGVAANVATSSCSAAPAQAHRSGPRSSRWPTRPATSGLAS